MAIRGILSTGVQEYICRDDPSRTKEDGATVFYHRPIANAVVTRIADQQKANIVHVNDMSTQTFAVRTAHRNREAFRYGVSGWDNFFTGDGEPIKFETTVVMEGGLTYTVVAEAAMDKILHETIQEVGMEIWDSNTLTNATRKNFEASLSVLGGSLNSSAETATTRTNENEGVADRHNSEPDGDTRETAPTTEQGTTGKIRPTKSGKTPARAASS